jgi:hypothetical protein
LLDILYGTRSLVALHAGSRVALYMARDTLPARCMRLSPVPCNDFSHIEPIAQLVAEVAGDHWNQQRHDANEWFVSTPSVLDVRRLRTIAVR